jgi:hypothetical protein
MGWEQTLAATLARQIDDLHRMLATHHGAMRGTYEAVLAEAQGGELIGGLASEFHFDSLKQFHDGLANRVGDIRETLRSIAARDPRTAGQLSDALRDLMQLARQRMDLANRTFALCRELARKNSQGLLGVPLQTGQRTVGSLVSSQLGVMRQGLKLVPDSMASTPWVRQILDEIRELPVSLADAARKVGGTVAAARAALSVTAGRVAASAAMRVFSAVLQSLWSVAGRLILPIIILDHNGNPIGLPGTSRGPDST